MHVQVVSDGEVERRMGNALSLCFGPEPCCWNCGVRERRGTKCVAGGLWEPQEAITQ